MADPLWDAIVNALRLTIQTHGPITRELLTSATKRIVQAIVDLPSKERSEYDAMIVDTLDTLNQNETSRLNTIIAGLKRDLAATDYSTNMPNLRTRHRALQRKHRKLELLVGGLQIKTAELEAKVRSNDRSIEEIYKDTE